MERDVKNGQKHFAEGRNVKMACSGETELFSLFKIPPLSTYSPQLLSKFTPINQTKVHLFCWLMWSDCPAESIPSKEVRVEGDGKGAR
ncbi:hypothetical protein JTE90_022959 [Oedothorax gibbosus]|uniref:Uncharacterized protein n=1 Tax=Oedothorax gibbosus TaxID=931172 RepID=A0AAV6VBH7_9ARAC|nr:hypothetical protein JTE90_022959 [Oedothorax gibbosus]